MDIPLAKLLRLLSTAQPEAVRCAALLVLGELGIRNGDIAESLCTLIDDAIPAVRLEAIRAVGKLRISEALPPLLERVKAGGAEAEAAAHAAAALGAKGVKALQELMHKIVPGVRKYIAAALGAAGTGSGSGDAVAVLLERDPALVETAVRSLITQVPQLSPAQRRQLTKQLLALCDGDEKLRPASEAGLVRLLSALDEPDIEEIYWQRIQAGRPSEVRSAALQALGKHSLAPGKEQFKRLLACATDRDFRIAAPALMLLKTVPVKKSQLGEWLTLLEAPDRAARLFAVEQLGEQDTPEVARGLLQQLTHPDQKLREAALARLQKLDQGWAVMWDALLQAETPDRAWHLARALLPAFRNDEASRQVLFSRAGEYVEANDRRADALLFLLRETAAADLKQRIEERALALRKKKNYSTALQYLRLLTRDPACGFPLRLEHAACALKVSPKDVATEARAADPCLEEFVSLHRHHPAILLEELTALKWLEPEDLFYLGFHCTEQPGAIRKLGAQVLELVVTRAGKTKLGQAARSKLRSVVVD